MTARRPQRPYHHGSLRRTLMDAALKLIESGTEEFSLRELARNAGVSSGAPYHHFAEKAELMAALAEEGFVELAAREREALAVAGAGFAPRLKHLARAYVQFAAERPAHFRVMFRHWLPPGRSPGLKAAAESAFAPLRATLEGAYQSGELMVEPRAASLAAWSMVHGLSALWVQGPVREMWNGVPPHKLADEVTEQLGRAFRRG